MTGTRGRQPPLQPFRTNFRSPARGRHWSQRSRAKTVPTALAAVRMAWAVLAPGMAGDDAGVAPKQVSRTYVGSQAWSHPLASR